MARSKKSLWTGSRVWGRAAFAGSFRILVLFFFPEKKKPGCMVVTCVGTLGMPWEGNRAFPPGVFVFEKPNGSDTVPYIIYLTMRPDHDSRSQPANVSHRKRHTLETPESDISLLEVVSTLRREVQGRHCGTLYVPNARKRQIANNVKHQALPIFRPNLWFLRHTIGSVRPWGSGRKVALEFVFKFRLIVTPPKVSLWE